MKSERILIAVIIGNVALGVLSMLPGLLAEMSRLYGFSDQQLGYLASADLLGLTVGTLLWKPALARYGLRNVCFMAGLLLFLTNASSMAVVDYAPLVMLRFAAGLCAGGLHAVSFIVMGASRKPERSFGLFVAGLALFGAVALLVVPLLADYGGIKLIYLVLAVSALIAIVLGRGLPISTSPGTNTDATECSSAKLKSYILPLFGVFAIFSAGGAYWAYMSRIGENAGFAARSVSIAASSTQIFGFLGASLATYIGLKFGSIRPLLASFVLMFAMCALLTQPIVFMAYVIAICLLTFGWNFSTPLTLGLVAQADSTGSASVYAATSSNLGLALGPLVAASLLSSESLAPVLYLTAALAFASLIVAMIPWFINIAKNS
jgi:predicted MFS family arabinose efflux permease